MASHSAGGSQADQGNNSSAKLGDQNDEGSRTVKHHKPSSWASLLGRFSQRSMQLKFVEPITSNGTLKATLTPSIVEQGFKEWELSLVGHFLDSNLPFNVASSIVRKLWAKEDLTDVLSQGNGAYIFRFSHDSGRKAILEGGP